MTELEIKLTKEIETLKAKNKELRHALWLEAIVSINDHQCSLCGSEWALGSPHEYHREDCPLYDGRG